MVSSMERSSSESFPAGVRRSIVDPRSADALDPYLLPLAYILYGLSCQNTAQFAIWLKSTGKFTVPQINVIPTGLSGIQIFCTLLWGFASDYTGSRFAFTLGPLMFGLIPCGILAVFPAADTNLILAAFFLMGVQFMTPIIYSWWNEICSRDPLERGGFSGIDHG